MPSPNYDIIVTKKAFKQLKKIDHKEQNRITEFLKSLQHINPKSQGKELKGSLSGVWRYRVGSYRILTHIEDEKLTVLVVKIGHRKDIYK